MEFKLLSKNFKIPVIGLGTWGIGGFLERDDSRDEDAIKALINALELGYAHLDTAELYGAGHAEELIGEAIKNFKRSDLIITSKVSKTNLKYDDVIASCRKSLERLKTDCIDIYLIHAPNPEIPLRETMAAMDSLIARKLVKFIGVSNFSVEQMKEAQKYSKNKIIVNQIPYSLNTRNFNYRGGCQDMEAEIIPYCQENNLVVMAYRPIERGFILKTHPLLDKLSEKYKKTKVQIAINWLISKKNIITIPKSTNFEHLKENLGALGWRLRDEDQRLLDKAEFETPELKK